MQSGSGWARTWGEGARGLPSRGPVRAGKHRDDSAADEDESDSPRGAFSRVFSETTHAVTTSSSSSSRRFEHVATTLVRKVTPNRMHVEPRS